jgi:hypothetical protein
VAFERAIDKNMRAIGVHVELGHPGAGSRIVGGRTQRFAHLQAFDRLSNEGRRKRKRSAQRELANRNHKRTLSAHKGRSIDSIDQLSTNASRLRVQAKICPTQLTL